MALTKITNSAIADDIGLGGNPTTSTQTAGDSTTRIATTAFVSTAVANLVDSAPATLNTLNELAAAIGDNATFSSTMTTSIASKLPLAGGTLTGGLTGTTGTFSGALSSGAITSSGDVSAIETGHAKVVSNSVGDYFPSLEIKRTSGSSKTDKHWMFQIGSTGHLHVKDITNNTNALVLRENGDVYIGADSSALNPIINVDVSASSATFAGNIGVTGTVDGIDIAARDAVLTSTTTTAGAALPKAGGTMTGNIQLNNNIELRTLDTGGNARTIVRANSSNELEFGWSANSPVKFMGGGSYTERMRIHTNGNIAINHTSAPHTLTVKGTISRLNSSGIQVTNLQTNNDNGQIAILNSGGVQKVLIDSNGGSTFNGGAVYFTGGNVGIGTTAPNAKLTVRNSTTATDTIVASAGLAVAGNYHNLLLADGANYAVGLRRHITVSNPSYLNPRLDFFVQNTSTYLPADRGVKMTILGSGNVGIGTDAPANKLHVKAGASGASTFDSRYNLTLEDDGENYIGIYSPSNSFGGLRFVNASNSIRGYLDYYHGSQGDKMQIYAQNEIEFAFPSVGEQVTFKSGGSSDPIKVGIGATSPGGPLHVKSSTNKTIIADATLSSSGSITSFAFQRNSADKWRIIQQADDSHLSFYNDQTSDYQFSLKSDGKVGIGTTAPTSLLEVKGANGANGIRLTSPSGLGSALNINGSGYAEFYLYQAGGNPKVGLQANGTSYFLGGGITVGHSAEAGISGNPADLNYAEVGPGFIRVNRDDTADAAQLSFGKNGAVHSYLETRTNGLGFVTNVGDFAFEGGNVGIGTASPIAPLHVAGNAVIETGSPDLYFATTSANHTNWRVAAQEVVDAGFEIASGTQSAGSNAVNDTYTTRFTIKNTGNVGIGTTNPQAKLHVDGTTIFDTATGSQPVYFTRLGNINESLKIHCDDRGAVFESIQDETADTYGNFIFAMDAGVTEPYFDVRKGSADSASIFRVDGGGNVGIGTTAPGAKLQVTVNDATEYSTTEASEINPVGTDALYLHNEENSSTNGKVSIHMRSSGGGGSATARITLKNERSGSGGLGFFFRDNGHTGEQQEKMYLSSDGNLTLDGTASFNSNVGIGCTPSAWAFSKALQLGDGASLATGGNQNMWLSANLYLASDATFKYITNNKASQINLYNGGVTFSRVATGTAGATATIQESGRFDNSGNFLVGTTSTAINTSTSVAGHNLFSSGYAVHARSGQTVMSLNRQTNDGTIADFRRGGTIAGLVGVKSDTSNPYMVIGKGSVGLQFASDTDAVSVLPARADNLSLTNGAMDIGSSTQRFRDLYLSSGVYLGGTGAANLLDDYEEGTFTGRMSNSDSGGTYYDSTGATGYYRKIGSLVHIQIHYTQALSGTGSAVYLNGLPFPASYFTSMSHWIYEGFSNLTAGYSPIIRTQVSRSAVIFQASKAGSASFDMSSSHFGGGVNFMISGSYITA